MRQPKDIAATIIQQATFRDPRMPPDEELVALARAYLAVSRPVTQCPLYVSDAAARRYAVRCDLDLERARRELTAMLLHAHPVAGDPSRWRVRTGRTDITALVRPDEAGTGLLVVTAVEVHHR